jgi:hypothetical protein
MTMMGGTTVSSDQENENDCGDGDSEELCGESAAGGDSELPPADSPDAIVHEVRCGLLTARLHMKRKNNEQNK